MVEGARLESVYTAYPRIEGSNPSLSASYFKMRRPGRWRSSRKFKGKTRGGPSLEPNSARWATRCHLARITGLDAHLYGGPVGPPATIVCESRQVRKEATVANDSGAGVWLAGPPPFAGAESFA